MAKLNDIFRASYGLYNPPEDLNVDEWADKYRRLDGGLSAEAGQWRTSRTPYMREPMRAFRDPRVEEIVFAAPGQIGKSELELNIIGYIIDQDPGTILEIQPDLNAAEEFSKLRIDPMLRSVPRLADKVQNMKLRGRKATATTLMKSFPGGMLNIAGSHSASALSSKPIRYIIGDELDRWAVSAGRDGDPWELAKKRQATYYNRKRVAVSTPTIKGASQIESLYYRGTQERWKTLCPHCHQYHEIKFADIQFTPHSSVINGKTEWYAELKGWRCPACGGIVTEQEAKRQPARWEADNPDALEKTGCRSFWGNGFMSPWADWKKIVHEFLTVKDDPDKLKVFKNVTLGELWEIRSSTATEEELMNRAEDYPTDADLPGDAGSFSAPLVLTCGVDCQHNYLQYEVVGWTRFGESWGIRTGYIMGAPDDDKAWAELDAVVRNVYRFRNGRGLRVSLTFVDSGDGNYTNQIAARCAARREWSVFAVKGDGKHGLPLLNPPSKLAIGNDTSRKYWLYRLGVSAGKAAIMEAVKVEQPAPNYMHLPKGEDRGYDFRWYHGLLSETEIVSGRKIEWVKLAGHERNEPLDCRNYARAAYMTLNPDYERISAALRKPKDKAVKKRAVSSTRKKTALGAMLKM